MEDFIEIHSNTLSKYEAQGLPLPDHIVDYLYQQGYMCDEEYKKFYMDTTRMHKPKLQKIENDDLALELQEKCTRMETIENKNNVVYQAKKQQQVNKGFFG